MPNVLQTGVLGTATVTGTGNYTGISNVTGYRTWASMTDGNVVEAVVKSALNTFESVNLTKSGGATPVLARTTVLRQTDGTTNAVNWPTNTAVEIYSAAGGDSLMSRRVENALLANQHMGAFRVTFDDNSVYINSSGPGKINLVGPNGTILEADDAAPSTVNIRYTDSGAGVGPNLVLHQLSGSPAVNDVIGDVLWVGRNASLADVTYVDHYCVLVATTAGAHSGRHVWRAWNAGLAQRVLSAEGAELKLLPEAPSGVIIWQKDVTTANTSGMVLSDKLYITKNAVTPLIINRTGNDGGLIEFWRDAAFQGQIAVAAGVVSYAGAVMSHPSEWGDGGSDSDDLRGVVVCSAEGLLEDDAQRHPLCRISNYPADPTVYGVVQGRMKWVLSDQTEIEALQVEGVGSGLIRVVGPVNRGDLLETSAVPGCAQAQMGDMRRVVRSSTVAKAVQSSPHSNEVRLIPCTLMAG